MDTNQKDSQLFSSAWILELYKANRNLIHVITAISVVVFLVIALILPSEYRATVILFPASNESASHTLLSGNESSKGLSRFGETEEVEYFLQVLYSDQIKEYITHQFDLFNHYNIDTTSSYPKTKLTNKWENNISFRKTEFLSIEIEVFDKDPVYAAKIANTIADYSDTLYNKIKHERAKKAFEIVKKEYFDAINDVQKMQDSLQKLRELGVVNYEAQSEVYSDAYAQALAKGNKDGAKAIEEKFKILAQYGGTYQMFDEILTNESKRLSELKQKYIEAKVDAEQYIPYKFIVSRAEVPEKAYYPIRWLVFLGGVLSTLILTFFILAFVSQKKKSEFKNEQ
ncbi:MAG TPA: hypothetical protein PLP65_03445 [Bacteroidales bacterium]|nr:hypothetical protein [Bacteroidales bacterium]